MPTIRFARSIQTRDHGTVTAGQELDVSAKDADRYIRNQIAVAVDKPKPAARKRGAARG